MAAFVQLTRPNGARFSVNVDHIIEFWEPGESWAQDMTIPGGGGLTTTETDNGEATMTPVREPYEEIGALLSLAGHPAEDRTAAQLLEQYKRDREKEAGIPLPE